MAVLIYIAALIFATALVVGASFVTGYYYSSDIGYQLLSEGHGLVFDLVMIGVFVTLLSTIFGRRQELKRYQEEIDDFKRWKVREDTLADEAFYRIRGNVERLSRAGQKIDLSNLCLGGNLGGNAALRYDLRGIDLSGANLNHADLSGADLEGAILRGITARKASLNSTLLNNSDLTEAVLTEGVDWEGATLDGTILDRAHLSGAKNLTSSQLAKARSLYRATMDNDQLKQQLEADHPELFHPPN